MSPLKFQIDENELSMFLADPLVRAQSELDDDHPECFHDRVSSSASNIPCTGAGHMACYISPYGDVFPCAELRLLCGNLREKSFDNIWRNSPELLKVRSITTSDLPACSHCDLLKYCRNCPGTAFLYKGDPLAPVSRACMEATILKTIEEKR